MPDLNIKSNSSNKSSANKIDVKNLFFSISIFILICVILLISYSIYQKLANNNKSNSADESEGKISEIIQVEVLNGCGASGIADRFTEYLRTHGCDVVSSSNYSQFDVQKTIVIDRIGNPANAKYIADLLGVKNIITQINKEYFLDVSVIIGNDYRKLKVVE